jgi:hypothetical protein
LRFDQPEWLAGWRAQKTRHISLHIAKASLKLYEGKKDQVIKEVIPDLSIYRTQLINTHDLATDICDRTDSGAPNVNSAIRELAGSTGELAHYLEPAERGKYDDDTRVDRVTSAVRHLHIATEGLAWFYGVEDVAAAHSARIQELLGPDAVLLDRVPDEHPR